MPGDYFSQEELTAIGKFAIPQLQQVLTVCKNAPKKADEIKYQLGLRYAQALEYQTALNYFEEAAKNQHTEASYYAAMFYQKNWGTTLDLKERQKTALIYFTQAAQNNHQRALEELGTIYHNGLGILGITSDLDKAFEYYTKSKTPGAHTALGVMYRADTLPKSKEVRRADRLAQAKYHLEQAGQFPPAQYQLASLLKQFAREEHDHQLFPTIIELYTSAARTLPEAQCELAWIYYKGLYGKEANHPKALELYKEAAEKGHTAAQAEYAYLLAENGDTAKAITWYETAIQAPSPPPKVFYNLAILLEDFDKKVRLLKIAANEYNQADAQFALGRFYYDKKLIASGIESWNHYLSKAAANRHPEAIKLLQAIHQGKAPLPEETHFTPIKPTASPQHQLMRSISHSPTKTDSPPKTIKSSSPDESESPFNLEQETSDVITEHLTAREARRPPSLSPIFSVKEISEPALLTRQQMLTIATTLKTQCATAPKIIEPLLPTLSPPFKKKVIEALQDIHRMADEFQSLIYQSTDQQCQKPLLQRIATRGKSIIELLETLSKARTPEKLLEITQQLFPKKVHLPEPPPPQSFFHEFPTAVQPQNPRFFKRHPIASGFPLSETRRRCQTRLLELYTRIDKAQLADNIRHEMQDNILQTLGFVAQGTEQRLALKTLVLEAQIGCLERNALITEPLALPKIQQSDAQDLLRFYCCACIAFNIVATTPNIIEQQSLFEKAIKPERLALRCALDFHLKLATLTLAQDGKNANDYMYTRIKDIAIEMGLLADLKQTTNTFSL